MDNQLLKTLAKHQIGVRSVEELTHEQLKQYLEDSSKVSDYYVPDLATIKRKGGRTVYQRRRNYQEEWAH